MSEQGNQGSSSGRGCSIMVGMVFLVIGLALAGFGGKKLYDSWQLFNLGEPVTGTVIGYDSYIDDEQTTRYQAIINYQVGPTVFSHKDPDASLSPKFKTYQPVELLYMPDRPDVVVINRPVDLWINPLLPLGGGIFSILVGFGFLWVRKK